PDTPISPSGMRAQTASLAAQATGGGVLCYMVLILSPNNFDIFFNRFDDGGKVTSPPRLTQTANHTAHPQGVTQGRSTWVLWDEYNDQLAAASLNWQFLDEAGAPLLPVPFEDATPGWRPRAAVTGDALYAVQYGPDPSTNQIEGQIIT